jgi:hypothetical protein
MKKEDLQIGDWVFSFHAGRNVQIKELLEDSVVCSKNLRISADENIVIESYDNISPIELTEEILEKNGFKYSEWYGWQIKGPDFTLCFVGGTPHFLLDELFVCNCPYVHTLQHALKLCEIEKKIVL